MFRRNPQKPKRGDRTTGAAAYFAEGIAALDRGDLEAGRHALLQSLQAEVPVVERMIDVADQLASVGFAADAEHVLRRALEQYADYVEAKLALARLMVESGNERRAIQVAVQALQEHPRDPELHIVAAIAHERLGSLPEAANHLATVLATDADHLDANRRLAPILERVGDRAGAVRCMRRVVAVTDGQDLDALTALGIALSGDGQHGEAVHLLSDVVRRRPDVVSVRADMAMALLSAGQIDDALTGFSEVLRLDPQSAQAYCGMGLVYQQLQRWREAADAFRTTEALAPDKAVGPFNMGLALSALGDVDEARRALLRAAAIEPEDLEIREALQSLLINPVSAEAGAPVARFNGDLKSFELPEVLEFLRLQSKTGSLVLSSRQGAGIVRIVRGKITSASAPGVKRLGEALVARGLVTRDGLDTALARQKSDERESAEALGDVLMRDRPGDRDQLTRVVFQQVLDALGEMLGWKEGAFSFHPANDTELPAISFDVQNVMLEILRVTDEGQADRSSN